MEKFDHMPNGPQVHPASDSIANPQRWITVNALPVTTPGQRMQSVHACLIPFGPHRGEVLVWDGNLRLIGTRAHQPWAIVNPYWPNPNPFVAGGGSGYRFHNATLQMPVGQGELFCAGQRWLSNGRLFTAGGTRVYPPADPANPGNGIPPVNTGMPEMWEGAALVYQWDATPTAGSPFGTWHQMPSLEEERWYPTVTTDGTADARVLVLSGSDIPTGGMSMPVRNDYEAVRYTFSSFTPSATVESKTVVPTPPPSARRYAGTTLTVPFLGVVPGFTEYPRVHALGMLDPISGGQEAPRLFVSGYWGQGIRWAHDPDTNPTYFLDVGQEVTPSYRVYSTSILYPPGIDEPAALVVRIGGERYLSPTNFGPTNQVESVDTSQVPSTWSSGTPSDLPDLLHARHLANVVLLPDGTLFAVGGIDGSGPNYQPELLIGGSWRPMAQHSSPRDYHSISILLPDGSVLCGGGESRTWDYEIWQPDYLKVPVARRPQNVGLVDTATNLPVNQNVLPNFRYDLTYAAGWTNKLPAGVSVDRAVLMAPAALTHHDDGGQRRIQLLVWQTGPDPMFPNGSVKLQSPRDERIAPPGWYMLFLLTNEGALANAFWVNLRQ